MTVIPLITVEIPNNMLKFMNYTQNLLDIELFPE